MILKRHRDFRPPLGIDVESDQDLIHYIKTLPRSKKVDLQTFFIEYMRCKDLLVSMDIIDNGFDQDDICCYQYDINQFERFMKRYNQKIQFYY